MTHMQDPQPDWGDTTEWQKPADASQTPYGGASQSPYGGGYQQPPGAASPPYSSGYQQPPPGAPLQYPPGPAVPAIQTYLVPAILVTLFCFLPTGVAAIVFASQVSSKRDAGDYAGAVEASKKARIWTIVSLVVGVLFGIILVVSLASQGSNSGY